MPLVYLLDIIRKPIFVVLWSLSLGGIHYLGRKNLKPDDIYMAVAAVSVIKAAAAAAVLVLSKIKGRRAFK